MILPDGLFNNQGDLSNCPQVRNYLIKHGKILAVISLPDYAFRRSGAQNKTTILFYQRYSYDEKVAFDSAFYEAKADGLTEEQSVGYVLKMNSYKTFMAEAHNVGYSTTGTLSERNDLYKGFAGGHLDDDQTGTILGENNSFIRNQNLYVPGLNDCIALNIYDVWCSHASHRLDPKYHLFKNQERQIMPKGWKRKKISELMQRREEVVKPDKDPDLAVRVLTISQTGDLRDREAGKGKNPPEWLGMYFNESPLHGIGHIQGILYIRQLICGKVVLL